MSLLQCYNKGCGQKYDPENNEEDCCQFHPGGPIFHDALKGWSCCKKRSTDFSEFLSIPGCSRGHHSNCKPAEPAPAKDNVIDKAQIQGSVTVNKEEVRPPNNPTDRPSADETMVELKKTVGATLQQALDKQMKELNIQNQEKDKITGDKIPIGTSCKNNACSKSYQGEVSNSEACVHHPGVPIFHEGLKFWSCCQKKTTEFDNFLQQEGCNTGEHVWIKEDVGEKKSCRYDWHQTGSTVIISVYSKVALPDKCSITANRVACSVHIVFEGGKSLFEEKYTLFGVIDPTKSSVKMVGTKVEITLRKAELFHWPDLIQMSTDEPAQTDSGDLKQAENNETLEQVGF